ncbi:50S ribosomal protein L10 [Candidatus Woesearchaeota archaeon]|nr:50S ribosomal protein L10 [Candidatus Woesearchaeota archaeon]
MKAKTLGNKNARKPADYAAKAAKKNKRAVEAIAKFFGSYSVVAVVNLESLPAAQLQRLRNKLYGDMRIVMTKKTLLSLILTAVKGKLPGVEMLAGSFVGMPALIFTNQSPFKLANLLQKNKSKAPAKPGQTAPYDIVIPAGPTSFTPGPIISELAAVGIKAGVEGGKIAIKVPATIVREGEKIKPKVAEMLAKFNIQPMEIGLNLVAAYEKETGLVYGRDVLSVSSESYLEQLRAAAYEAFALAVEMAYATRETAARLVGKAFLSAKHLAEKCNIPAEGSGGAEPDVKGK